MHYFAFQAKRTSQKKTVMVLLVELNIPHNILNLFLLGKCRSFPPLYFLLHLAASPYAKHEVQYNYY